MKFFELLKALTRKKTQPKDYNEPTLFDELTDFFKQQEPSAGQTKTVNGKTYTLQPSSHPGWLRWQAQDGSELITDEQGNELKQKETRTPEKSAESNREQFLLNRDRVRSTGLNEIEKMVNREKVDTINIALASVQSALKQLQSPPEGMEPRHFKGAIRRIKQGLSEIDRYAGNLYDVYQRGIKERDIHDVLDELKQEFEKVKPEAEKKAGGVKEEPKPKPKAEPEKAKEPGTEAGGEYEEDLFGNRIYRVGTKQFALIKKEDGKTTLTRVPEAKKAPEIKQEPETEDLFSQINNMMKKPKEAQKDSETVETPTKEEKAPEKPKEEEIDPYSQKSIDEVVGEKPEKIQFGAEGLKGGKKSRKNQREQINKQVKEILQKPASEITEADKKILAKYSGRGGTDEVSLNEYYTISEIASLMWGGARQLGFRGGPVYEPCCATGVFIHTAPDDAIVTGIEIDETSSKIAQILHGDRHEIIHSSLEQYVAKNGDVKCNLVITNSPFGSRGETVMYDREKAYIKNADQYFVDRGLSLLNENGLLVMIVPTGIMDNITATDLRNDWNKQAEFLGAIRLPTGAFHHAHAEVSTDIVFFRKRPDHVTDFLINADSETINKLKTLGIMDGEFTSGRFFEKNPEFTMGEEVKGNYGRSIWKGELDLDELKSKFELLKPHKDNYEALKEFGIDVTSTDGTPSPKVGQVMFRNGRQYRFNENSRWERVAEDEDKEIILTDEESAVAFELSLTPAEFMALRRNILIDGTHLTDEQLKVVSYGGESVTIWQELSGLVNIPLSKMQKCRQAALLGLAIQKLEWIKGLPNSNRENIWSMAKQLEGKLGEFVERFGNPSDLNKYLDKGKRKAIQTLYSTIDADGVISKSITDPYDLVKDSKSVTKTKGTNDLYTVEGTIKELYESGEEVNYRNFKGYYRGEDKVAEDRFEIDLLANDNIGIDESGNFAPEKEIYLGQVTDKLDSWSSQIDDINDKLARIDEKLAFGTDEATIELLRAKKDKLESQSRRIRELAGYKGIVDLPVRLGDAKSEMFDISLLNEYLAAEGIDMELTIDYSGKINFSDSRLAQIYELYHDKSALEDAEKKQLKSLLKDYYQKQTNPFDLIFLNTLNGIPVTRMDEESKAKITGLEKKFKEFLDNREEGIDIAEKYNRTYNNWVMKEYNEDIIEGIEKLDYDKKLNRYAPDGTQLTIRDSISPNQWGSIRRLVDQGKGMLAHGVGVGKTLQAIVSIAIMKQEGKCTKPLVVTPKSVLLNWNEEANLWLKNANVLVVGYRKNKNGQYTIKESNGEVRAKMIEIQKNGHNYDLILMARDTFGGLDFEERTKKNVVDNLVSKYFENAEGLTKKQKQKLESLKQRFAKEVSEIKPRFEGIKYEDLGIDLLVRDESHDVKNLLDAVSFQDVKGLQGASSSRSLHNYIASSIVRNNNDGRNVIMLTATPVSNTPLEIFNMMLPFAEEDLAKMSIRSIDDFVNRFAEIDTEPTTDADGSLVTQEKFVGWSASETLRKIFFRFVDYKTHKDVKGQNIRFPKENSIHEFTHLNEGQKQLINHCRLRLWANRMLDRGEMREIWQMGKFDGNIDAIIEAKKRKNAENGKEDPIETALRDGALTQKDLEELKEYGKQYINRFLEVNRFVKESADLSFDGFFKIQSDMIKATADLEWYKDKSSEFSQNIDDKFIKKFANYDKLNRLTELVGDEYRNGGKQVIFAINVNLHEKIKESLIKAGIKPEEIIIVNGDTVKGSDKRLRVSNDFNSGKYKVVIGNYATMGEGLNFNNGTTKGYHLQPPWNSLQYEQGNGRFIRQGNPKESVDVHYFLTKGSIDAFMNQKVLDKKDMVEKFLKGETNEWEDDVALSADDMLIELARSPEEAKKLIELKKKNEERASAQYDTLMNLRKLTRYHNNIRDMKKIKDKSGTLYSRLKKENESIENDFNGSGHEYSKFLDSSRSYLIDDKTGYIIPEHSIVDNGTAQLYIKKINHLDKSCEYVDGSGARKTISFKQLLEQMMKNRAEVNANPTDILFTKMTEGSKSLDYISNIVNSMPADMLSPDQIEVIKKSMETELKRAYFFPKSKCFLYDPETNELVNNDRSYEFSSSNFGYKLILPIEPHFATVVNNSEESVLQEYSSDNESFRDIYSNMMRKKYPTTHEPVRKLAEIEELYKNANGYSDYEFESAKKRKYSNIPSEIRSIYNDVKKGDFTDYAELVAQKLVKDLIAYEGFGNRWQQVAKGDLNDPETLDRLNFVRGYSYSNTVSGLLESIERAYKNLNKDNK